MKVFRFSLAFFAALTMAAGAPVGVFAEDKSDLQAQQPAEDTPKPAPVLNGSVTKLGGTADEGNEQPLDGTASFDNKFAFVKKLKKGQLTADDYRQVGFGVTGFELLKPFFARYPTVLRLFPGCPAEQAGVKVGDVLIKAGEHTFTRRDMQPEFWKVLDGRAGTTIDVTVIRDGELMTLHVVRMNIEDVPNARLRLMYERMLRVLGDDSDPN